MGNLYVTFTVKVSDKEHSYGNESGRAETKIQVPREVLENIDPGNFLIGVLHSALANFDNVETKEEGDA